MEAPQDQEAFWTAMERLSIALTITLSEERAAVYWDALCDLRLEDVQYACQHAARHWRPTEQERVFPLPATLREFALVSRDKRLRQVTAKVKALLPQWNTTPDEAGIAAIRQILHDLGDTMDMMHPVYREPSTDDPEKRKQELREQVRWLINPGEEDLPHATA